MNEIDLMALGFDTVEWGDQDQPTLVVEVNHAEGNTDGMEWEDYIFVFGLGIEEADLNKMGFIVIEWNHVNDPIRIMKKEVYDVMTDPFYVSDGNTIAF